MCEIRTARVGDEQELLALNVLLNGEGLTTAQDITRSLACNPTEIVCVAADGAALAGFCCAQVLSSVCYRAPEGLVRELFVRKEYRRQGVGKALMDFAEAEMARRGVRDCFLVTGDDNTRAHAFYAACGYHNDEEIQFHKEITGKPTG